MVDQITFKILCTFVYELFYIYVLNYISTLAQKLHSIQQMVLEPRLIFLNE